MAPDSDPAVPSPPAPAGPGAPGSVPPPGAPRLSQRERAWRTKAARMAGNANGHILVNRAAKSIKWQHEYRDPVSDAEASRLVDTLLRDLWDDLQAERAAKKRAGYVKNLTAALAITVDKRQLLASKPTAIVATVDAAQAAEIRALGLKLARLASPQEEPR